MTDREILPLPSVRGKTREELCIMLGRMSIMLETMAREIDDLTAAQKSPQSVCDGADILELFRLLRAREKIPAIKLFRSMTGSDLKTAKNAIDSLWGL